MRSPQGYGSYRGQTGFRTFLKVFIAILAVVLLTLVGGYFFLQQYAVVTDDGVRYEIPFLQNRKPEATPIPSQPLVVESPVATPTPTPEPEPEPEPVEQPLHAVLLPRTALYDGTAQTQLTQAGGNAAVFDMKADDGTLGYVSEVPLAKELKTSDSNPAINAAIQALTAGEVYTVARVSCFKDNAAPYRNNSLAIKTNSGYNWRDAGNLRWMSPTNEAARQYVTDLCVELAQLGFDEILLDNAAYPTDGHLDYIKIGAAYDAAQFTSVVEGFYQQVKAALAAYPEVKLSIMGTEAALTDGSDPASGQTAALLADYASRVWMPAPLRAVSDYAAALARAGREDADTGLVLLGSATQGEDTSWAILTAP